MTDRRVSIMLRRHASDVLVGLVLFLLLIAFMAGEGGPVVSASAALGDPQTMLVLLAGVLSVLAAFDVAVLRYIYRVHVRPGRRRRALTRARGR